MSTQLPNNPVESGRKSLAKAARLLFDYAKRHAPPPRVRPERPNLPPAAGNYQGAIVALKAIPFVLLAAFALSFVWDFDGMATTLFGLELTFEGLMRTLAVGGLIGFGTNWLAIKMLFHPREKRALVGQGLIPAQRERVIHRLAVAVSEKLINPDAIRRKIEESQIIPRYREVSVGVARRVIEDPNFRDDLRSVVADYAKDALGSPSVRKQIVDFTIEKIEGAAGSGFTGLALKAYRAVGEDDFLRRLDLAVQALPEAVDKGLDTLDLKLDLLPDLIERNADELEQWATRAILDIVDRIDTYELVRDSMRRFDEYQLEDLVMKTSNEQMQYIQYLGGVLGVFGGFVIWQPVWATLVLSIIVLGVWGVDEMLTRKRREQHPPNDVPPSDPPPFALPSSPSAPIEQVSVEREAAVRVD